MAAPAIANSGLPLTFDLKQSYPNPINLSGHESVARIDYQIPIGEAQQVTISVYDLLGRKVQTLVDCKQSAGYYNAVWNGTDHKGRAVAAGIYFYRIKAGDFQAIRKIAVVR